MKTYQVHVQFEALGMRVRAKNIREAREKTKTRLDKKKPSRLIDKKNFFFDEL